MKKEGEEPDDRLRVDCAGALLLSVPGRIPVIAEKNRRIEGSGAKLVLEKGIHRDQPSPADLITEE